MSGARSDENGPASDYKGKTDTKFLYLNPDNIQGGRLYSKILPRSNFWGYLLDLAVALFTLEPLYQLGIGK